MKIKRYSRVYWIIYNRVSKKYPKASKKQKLIITSYVTRKEVKA